MQQYDLANLKSEFDKLDIDKLSELDAAKLKPFPTPKIFSLLVLTLLPHWCQILRPWIMPVPDY